MANSIQTGTNYYDANGVIETNTNLRETRFEVDTVDFNAVKTIFILLGIIYLLSMAILLFECYIFRKGSRK